MWMTARSLHGSASTVHIRGWQTEVILMIEGLMPFHLNLATWSWLKPMPTKGRGKWRTGGRRSCMIVEHQVTDAIPSYFMKNQWTGCSPVLHWNWLFLITHHKGYLPLYSCAGWVGKVCHHHPRGINSKREWDWGNVPQSVNCMLPTQWQTVETALGWVNRKLCVFLWMHLLECPCWIKGEKFNVEGLGVCRSQC